MHLRFHNDLPANWARRRQSILRSLLLVVLLIFVNPHTYAFFVEYVILIAAQDYDGTWCHQVRNTDSALFLFLELQ